MSNDKYELLEVAHKFYAIHKDSVINDIPVKEYLEIGLQALEQESVLDKIKAEIFNACSDSYHMPVYNLSCEQIFEIIDKYMTESEVRNDY